MNQFSFFFLEYKKIQTSLERDGKIVRVEERRRDIILSMFLQRGSGAWICDISVEVLKTENAATFRRKLLGNGVTLLFDVMENLKNVNS